MTDTDLTKITTCRWRLYGPDKAMFEAENKVLGDYKNHLSRIDWEPQDEDDEMPKDIEREITWYPPNVPPERMAQIWAIAAALGADARVAVYIATPAVGVWADSDAGPWQRVRLHTAAINSEFEARIGKVMRVLRGDGE